jgi:hypothetical protein
VPFQIEDWASDYKIPLGLTNNASVFSSTTMLVFLVNSKVSKITIWWNGSDTTKQTPYAYTNLYFTGDNPPGRTLTNGRLTLQFPPDDNDNGFPVTSTVGAQSAVASFMRINDEVSVYGASPAYVIHHGIVRDIIHQEAEWADDARDDGGAYNCPNVYAHIVLTLPANATYYTYQLRLMFINSQQSRNITDLCPIKIAASGTFSSLTENGTANGYPKVSTSAGSFYNMSNIWQHHWVQLNSTATRGFGIMFTDAANKMLYAFDNNTSKTGTLTIGTQTIELLPVTATRPSVSFKSAKDIIWYGAVANFDGTTPIYNSSTKSGLWIIVEYPPTITVTTQS